MNPIHPTFFGKIARTITQINTQHVVMPVALFMMILTLFIGFTLLVIMGRQHSSYGSLSVMNDDTTISATHVSNTVVLYRIHRSLTQKLTRLFDPQSHTTDFWQLKSVDITEKINTIEGISLAKGSYVLLADCSHQQIMIAAGEHTRINLKSVRFSAPVDKVSLLITCERFRSKLFDQKHRNTFEILMLEGRHRFSILISSYEALTQNHRDIEIPLAALKITTVDDHQTLNQQAFITHPTPIPSRTHAIALNEWIALYPGSYRISINGTETQINLKAGETQIIRLGAIEVKTPSSVDLRSWAITEQKPFVYEMITQSPTEFYPNTIYHLIEGDYKIAFHALDPPRDLSIQSGQLSTFNLHALTIKHPCQCEKTLQISLFQNPHESPVSQGMSDHPMFYYGAQILVSTSNSAALKTQLSISPDITHHMITAGQVNLYPQIIMNPHKKTELIRIEETSPPSNGYFGRSEDIRKHSQWSNTQPLELHLIPGEYSLVAYESLKDQQGYKKNRTVIKTFQIHSSQPIDIHAPIYQTPP